MDYLSMSYYLQILMHAKSLPVVKSTEPWRTPCAGSSISLYDLPDTSTGNLRTSLLRIDIKLEKLIIDLEYLKRKLVQIKFLDTEFLQTLILHPKLDAFPEVEDSHNTNILDILQRRYKQLSIVVAFFEYVPFHESNRALRYRGKQVLHDCLEILCEIETALSEASSGTLEYVSSRVVPDEYRFLTKSQRVSWTYILIRDTLRFIRQMHNQFHIFEGY